MSNDDVLRVCETCPWLTKNHGRKHPAGWYRTGNLRRLWTGLRTAKAPGMICHASDPASAEYGGKPGIKPCHERLCAGALTLIFENINALSTALPIQPNQPPLTKRGLAHYVWLKLIGQMPAVEDRRAEISLPWCPK